MKNHWLENYRRKNINFWTAEFQDKGLSVLKPRRVEVVNFGHNIGWAGIKSGTLSLIFLLKDYYILDKEFNDFLNLCKNNMKNWEIKLRKYHGIKEIEMAEVSGLSYLSSGSGFRITDVKLTFNYRNINYNHWI